MSQVTDTHIGKSASIGRIIRVALSLDSFSVEICKEQESKASGRNIENENSHRNILQRKRKDKQKDEERLIEVIVHIIFIFYSLSSMFSFITFLS